MKVLLLGITAALLAAVVIAKASARAPGAEPAKDVPLVAAATAGTQAVAPDPAAAALPRLVDLGAKKCIPCKAMAPILDQLRTDYAGRLEVRFIDVWETPDEASSYGVRVIPTQIFYAADGRELARHEGFMSREQILAQWKSAGVEL